LPPIECPLDHPLQPSAGPGSCQSTPLPPPPSKALEIRERSLRTPRKAFDNLTRDPPSPLLSPKPPKEGVGLGTPQLESRPTPAAERTEWHSVHHSSSGILTGFPFDTGVACAQGHLHTPQPPTSLRKRGGGGPPLLSEGKVPLSHPREPLWGQKGG